MTNKIDAFVGGLTQEETVVAAKATLGALENDVAINTVVAWAVGESIVQDVVEALDEADEAKEDDGTDEDDTDETEEDDDTGEDEQV